MHYTIKIKSILFQSLLLSLVLVLSACGGGGGGDNNGGSSVSVLTVSGGTVALDGNYKSQCHLSSDGLAYLLFSLAISGNNLVLTLDSYLNTNTNCIGTPVASDSAGFNISATTTTIATSGWVDGTNGIISPPNASDASGPLSNNESVTVLNFTVTSAGIIFTLGQTGQTFFVVDDTGAMPVMYFSDGYPGNSLVETIPTYYKQ